MFVTRLISGIVLLAVTFLTIMAGGPVLFFTLLAVSLIGMNELYRAAKVEDKKEGGVSPLALVGYGGAVLYSILVYFLTDANTISGEMDAGPLSVMMQESGSFMLGLLVLILIALMFVYVFTYPRYRSEQVTAAFFGVVYVAVMLSYIFKARTLPDGRFLVWLIFICSWGCDTCAYCVGMLIGKHKMSPKLSPKKSVEGAVGGVLGAALLGAVYAAAVGRFLESGRSLILEFALISAVGALISMVGDLAASAIKRNHGLKDYGKLIPGHGGILDRFDSVIFTAPVIYFLAVLLIG